MNLQGYTQITNQFSYNRFLRLGGGAYGNVYKGYDEKQQRHIAVKHIPRNNLSSVPAGQLQQVTIMKKLDHPNIMKCYGSVGDRLSSDGVFLFIQLCQKGTLNQLIPLKLSEKKIVQLFNELVDGMVYMNQEKFFHRDLKPENLLITADDHIKIADFGIARKIQSDPKVTFKKCTPIYSAPEVYLQQIYNNLNEQYNQKCDVFSAGYILYQMLTSEQLNKGVKTASQLTTFLMNNKKNGGFNIVHPAVSPKWKELLLRMLAFQAEKRPSFAEIKEILANFQPSNNPSMIGDYYSEGDRKFSEEQYKKVVNLIQLTTNRNNYLLSILKILNKYQQYRSQFVPKIYKILLLYFSIGRYCFQAEDGLKLLDSKDTFYLPYCEFTLAEVEEKFIPEYKAKLNEYIKKVSLRVNEGKQQMRIFLVNHIIPQMQQILKRPADNLQRMVLEQFRLKDSLEKLKLGEFEMDVTYRQGLLRCVDNLYHTAAEIEILPLHDLQIYLVCLFAARIDSFLDLSSPQNSSLPYKMEVIIDMDKEVLENLISVEKNKS